MKVKEIRGSVDLEALLRVWEIGTERRTWVSIAEKWRAEGNAERLQTAEGELAKLPPVSGLETLAANGRLVELLTAWRWVAMRDAREQGATWQEIADVLGISRQSAHEFYARKIAELNAGAHTARARAVLTEGDQK